MRQSNLIDGLCDVRATPDFETLMTEYVVNAMKGVLLTA